MAAQNAQVKVKTPKTCVKSPLICMARERLCCPACGAVRGEGYTTKSGDVVPGGFDFFLPKTCEELLKLNEQFKDMLKKLGNTIKIYAACRCANCGFSF